MAQVNLMVSRHSAFYSPLISTITGGFLSTEGLQPTYDVATPQRSVFDGLKDGSIHCAQSAISNGWGSLEKGQAPPVVHFAQINERDGFFLAAREPDPDFTWDKLKGKKVLVDHVGQPLVMFKFAVHKMGVDYAALDAVDAGSVDEIDKAFRGGLGDYVHQQGAAPQQLEKDGVGHIVASVGEAIGPIAFSSVCATREWLETDMAKAFTRAYCRARLYVNETPAEEIARAEADYFKGIDRDVLATTIGTYQELGCWNPDPTITSKQYEAALDAFLHSGLITKHHGYDQVVVPPPA